MKPAAQKGAAGAKFEKIVKIPLEKFTSQKFMPGNGMSSI
jgi:hypothetical protein